MRPGPFPLLSKKAGRVTAYIVGALLAIAVLMAFWIGARGGLAYQHLARIQGSALAAGSAIVANPAETAPVLEGLVRDARAARDLTSDPIWAMWEHAPWIGPQLKAFRAIASSTDQLFSASLLPLAQAARNSSLDSLRPIDGRIDTATLSALAEPARSAAVTSDRAAAAVRAIDRTPLIGAVGTAVDQADEVFSQSSAAIDGLSRAAQLFPRMLSQDSARSYLILVQNNAEWRSLGGISGTAILVRIDRGTISLADARSATALSRGITSPVVELPPEVHGLYENRPARYFHNLTEIPDFSIDGPLAREMYRAQTGTEVDGVLALDPVTLAYLLKAVGPVTLPGGESLTSENAVSTLMSDVYERYPDPSTQDAFFEGATGAVFESLLEGRGSTIDLVAAFAQAMEERRLLMWSADSDEQALIDGTDLAGHLPVTDETTGRFGVYLNDATGSKMSYYLEPTVTFDWGSCGSSERAVTMTLELTSSAPSDAATSLPKYVTGNGVYGTAPGSAAVVSNIYLPQGWTMDSATTSSVNGFTEATFDGRQVLTFGSTLEPGSNATIVITVTPASGAHAAEAWVTPTADSSLDPTVRATCERQSEATLQ